MKLALVLLYCEQIKNFKLKFRKMKLALVLLYCFLDFTDWGLTKKEKTMRKIFCCIDCIQWL